MKKNKIKCKICEKYFHQITFTHLYYKHGISFEEYKNEFGYKAGEFVSESVRDKHKEATNSLKAILPMAHKALKKKRKTKEFQEHFKEAQFNSRRGFNTKCAFCGNPLYRQQCYANQNNFCSNKCVGKYAKKKILQIKNGKVIKEWNGIREAGKKLGIAFPNIISVLNNGKNKSAGGFKWKYYSPQNNNKQL